MQYPWQQPNGAYPPYGAYPPAGLPAMQHQHAAFAQPSFGATPYGYPGMVAPPYGAYPGIPPRPPPPPPPVVQVPVPAPQTATVAAIAPPLKAPVAMASSEANAPMNVFVGKLPLQVHDTFIETLLKQCGSVLKWKRTMDSDTGKPKAFGFCTFSNSEAAMQAVKLLNDFDLEGSRILVKVGKKEQVIINQLMSKSGPNRTTAEEQLLQRIRSFVASVDPKQPVKAEALGSLGTAESSAAATEALPSGGDDHSDMIKEEMEKFRSKQAQRDRELEEERRRKLQQKIQEKSREEDSARPPSQPAVDQDQGKHDAKRRRVEDSSLAPAPADTASRSSPLTAGSTASTGGVKLGFGFGGAKAAPVTKSIARAAGFEAEEEKKRVLEKLDYSDDESPAAVPDAKTGEVKKRDKQLAERVPKDRATLYATAVDWDAVQRHKIVATTLRPWVVQKVVEYLGEEEPNLIEFVVSQLENRQLPSSIESELALVLEEDAAVLVTKLWRLLLFSILKASKV